MHQRVTAKSDAYGTSRMRRLDEPAGLTEVPGVIHAGTARRDDGALVSAGGRVLSVTATGLDLAAARDAAYALVAGVRLDGGHYRTDIALNAVEGRITL